MPVRGKRYLKPGSEWLEEFVINKLPYLDLGECKTFYQNAVPRMNLSELAFLGCNDRFYLLAGLMKRRDMLHPWVFLRCREVERNPDGFLDLWSRYHYKSSIITAGGAIQEIICDPEVTIAIFSVVKPIAAEFLSQIKTEFETNEDMKRIYWDVLYQNPRSKGEDGRPAKWSIARGITVKRLENPKEATVEAHGLLDGQPTSRHYKLHIYDDIITQDYLSELQLRKTVERWEMADNLGTSDGCRKWIAGTRYHFADVYSVILDRKSAKPRIYPATDNGKLNGDPVFLSTERWNEIKRDQRRTVSAQMLLNPVAGTEATFMCEYLRTYDIFPAVMNVYIMVDPSKGRTQRSDRTGIMVVGIDPGGNKYLIDGVCHRMKLAERLQWMVTLKEKWQNFPGVQQVHVGYEQYGQQADIEVIEENLLRANNLFEIIELGTPQKGPGGKDDRIERLEPDITNGRFYFPAMVWHPDFGGRDFIALWKPWTEADLKAAEEANEAAKERGELPAEAPHAVGYIVHRPMGQAGLTKAQSLMHKLDQPHRVVRALRRRDENKALYDVTRLLIEEMRTHPFATHDDAIDALSRVYDMKPVAPIRIDADLLLPPLEDDIDMIAGEEEAEGVLYDA